MGLGTVWFVGAGPGDPDLVTVKGRDLIARAGAILFAGSLVNEAATRWAPPGCLIADSKDMTLEQMSAWLIANAARCDTVVRLQTGDPALYGTLIELVQPLDAAGVLDGLGNLHLGVTGGIQDQWQHQHAARRPRRGQQAIVQRGRGKFDEADLDAPGRLARAPLVDEDADFLVAGVLARAVAHQQDRGVIHVVAFLKRCVKPGS